MSALNFYHKPTALNRETHRNLKLDTSKVNYHFAASTNSLLLAMPEMIDAAASYPVVFVGGDEGPYTLCAMVGMKNEENLFVDADGQWDEGSYVPAFVRRYPFVLSGAGGPSDDLMVCIDAAFAGFSEEQGMPLFDEEGKDTPLLQSAVDFMRNFHAEMQKTMLFCERLQTRGLLTRKNFEVQDKGHTHVIEGVVIVDPEKLDALDDATTLELVRSGDMALIHAHLLSIKQIPHLSVRHQQRLQAAA